MSYEITLKGKMSDLETVGETQFNLIVSALPESKYTIGNDSPFIAEIKESYYVPRIVDKEGNPLEEFEIKVQLGNVMDK